VGKFHIFTNRWATLKRKYMKNRFLVSLLFLLSLHGICAQNTYPPPPNEIRPSDLGIAIRGGNICSASVVPPTTIGGIFITATSSGVITYPSAYSSCLGVYVTPASSIHMGAFGAFSYTLNFSQPVNNLVFVLTATGHNQDEVFIFNTDSGVPTLTTSGSCYTTITGNVITSGAGAPSATTTSGGGGGGIFTVTAATNYTSLTITGPGGKAGSLMALCASSVAPVGCIAGNNTPVLSASSLTSACNATTVNLATITASNTPVGSNVTLAWFTGSVPSTANQLTPAQATIVPSGNTYYAAFFDSVNNCYSPATPVTTTTLQVVAPIFDPVGPYCFGETIASLPITSTNGILGAWSPAVSNTQTTTYTFTPGINQCATNATLQIEVLSDFDFEVIHYCLDNNFIMEIVPLNNSFAITDAVLNWETNAQSVGNNATFNVTSYVNSTASPMPLPIDFNVTVINPDGCTKTKPINVSSIYCGIQKGISANNDDLNDFFDLTLLDAKMLTIFNRYGMKVYDKANYINEWHGQTNSGDILPDGTYFYSIEFESEPVKTGWVYLNKPK
jgi:gliding motility-associated-like protein